MRPLLFLTFSQMRNSIRRSLTSVRRLIALLVAGAYYYWFIARMLLRRDIDLPPMPSVQYPIEVASAVVFGLAILVNLFFLSLVGVQRSGFRPADVDMLFPTPISPRAVVMFRIIRENFVALIYPLIFVILGGAALASLAKAWLREVPNREALTWLPYTAALSWLLVQSTWLAAGHAFSLGTANDRVSVWVKRTPAIIAVLALAVLVVFVREVVGLHGWSGKAFIEAFTSEPLRYLYFPAAAAAEIALMPLTGHYLAAGLSVLGYALALAVVLHLALRYSPALYEQAALAVASSQPSETAARSGDFMQYYSNLARQGKLKAGRFRWLSGLRWQGPNAVIWRDAVVSLRVAGHWYVLGLVGMGIYAAFLRYIASSSPGWGLVEMQFMFAGMIAFIATWTSSRAGFIDLLRKVDANKALPFTMMRSLFAQSLVRNLSACFWAWLFYVIAVLIDPRVFLGAIAFAVAVVPFAYVVSSSVLVHLLLFPDVEDSSQRMIREFLTMLTMLVALLPAGAVAAGLFALLDGQVLLAAVVASFVNVGVAALLLLVAAELYTGFNPSE
ncbi:MAG: hypothetical protein HRF45_01790 [Fimbriimonadia bacterium]|jgi:hypothetical protein